MSSRAVICDSMAKSISGQWPSRPIVVDDLSKQATSTADVLLGGPRAPGGVIFFFPPPPPPWRGGGT